MLFDKKLSDSSIPLAALDACARLRKGRRLLPQTNPCVLGRFFRISIIQTPIYVLTDFGETTVFKTGEINNQCNNS